MMLLQRSWQVKAYWGPWVLVGFFCLGERHVLIYPHLGLLGRIVMSYLGNAFERSRRAS